jgi:hypothetical protein
MLKLFYQEDIKAKEKHLKPNLEVYCNRAILFLMLSMLGLCDLPPFVFLSRMIVYIDNAEEKH